MTARAVLVTGAGSGIGLAIAARLRADGWDVLGTDLRDADHEADLSTRKGNRSAVGAAMDAFGRLDAVVPVAGFQHVAPVEDFEEDRWDSMLALLLTSPFLLAKYAWPALRDAPDGGRFVPIASAHGLVASPYKAAYVSAKHGVIGLCRTLALEGAEHGISATPVCPAYVRTPLVEAQIGDQARAHGLSEDQVLEDVILSPQAVKRLIEPAEVAAAVAFLLGPDGRAFTGAPFVMDQGWTAR